MSMSWLVVFGYISVQWIVSILFVEWFMIVVDFMLIDLSSVCVLCVSCWKLYWQCLGFDDLQKLIWFGVIM